MAEQNKNDELCKRLVGMVITSVKVTDDCDKDNVYSVTLNNGKAVLTGECYGNHGEMRPEPYIQVWEE